MKIKIFIFILIFLLSFCYSLVSKNKILYAYNSDPQDYGITNHLIFSKVLEAPDSMLRLNIGYNTFLVSDENENFYVSKNTGFYKFDEWGNYICSSDSGTNFQPLSNLVVEDTKIYAVSKNWPYYFYVFNTSDCSMEKKIKLYDNGESTPPSDQSIVSDILLSKDAKHIVFFSYYLARVYNYSISTQELRFDNVKTQSENPIILKNYFKQAGENLNESTFYNVDQHTGEIFVFDNANPSTFIDEYFFRGEYAGYSALSSGNDIPFGFNGKSIVTLFNKYLCSYPLQNAPDMFCKEFIHSSNSEIKMSTPIVSLLSAQDENIFLFRGKIENSTAKYYLLKYNSALEEENSVQLFGLNLGGLLVDGLNSVVATSDKIYAFDKNLDSIFTFDLDAPVKGTTYDAFIPDILGAGDSDVPQITPTPSQAIPNYYFPLNLYRTSAISVTPKGNFYVFQQYTTANYKILTKVFKFKGDKKVVVDPCPLNIYCNSTPKHHPVIFIHGLGGSYKNWFDEKTGVLRTAVLNKYREDDPEFPDSWAHAYSYGYDFNGDYNYQGKIEDISSNLHFEVARLSQESLAVGGDGKVDLIGYSLGGLVARHYILEKTGYPGEQNLEGVDHQVGKLILIASPVNGSSLLGGISSLEPGIRDIVVSAINKGLSNFQNRSMDITRDVGKQLSADSAYLGKISRLSLPDDIKYYRDYGNVRLRYGYSLFGMSVNFTRNLGDFAVYPDDTVLANATFSSSYLEENSLGVFVTIHDGKLELGFDSLPEIIITNHLLLPENPEIIKSVLEQLTN